MRALTMTAYLVFLVGFGITAFWVGAYTAFYLDEAEQKLPNVWGTTLEVKPNYGYQTDQYTPIQPAEDWQTLSTIEKL